jgi:hypothetical protein
MVRGASNCTVTKSESTYGTVAKWVKLHTDEGCWLGATGKWASIVPACNNWIQDEEAVHFDPGDYEFWFYFHAPNMKGMTGLRGYIIRLWSKRVEKSECKNGPCEWCRKNGYHLEGRLGEYMEGDTAGI